jgi:phosphatidylglycerophosphate synthase
MSTTAAAPGRRPLSTRDTAWAKALARGLARWGVHPNLISFASILFAFGGATCLYRLGEATGRERLFLAAGAVAGIQLRLLANLLDGLVAVEHGRKTATGDLWNEVPDRLADVALFLAAGYGLRGLPAVGPAELWGQLLGWCAAALALSTAYVRQLGGALGLPQDFRGPMAKQHRMFTLTLGALLSVLDRFWPAIPGGALAIALAVVVLGASLTLVRRLSAVARALEARLR